MMLMPKRIVSPARSNGTGVRGRRTFLNNYPLLIMCMPALLLLFIFHYVPLTGIVIAFKNFNVTKGIFGSDWVGFNNFKFYFTSQDALRTTFNTVGYNALFIMIGLVTAISFALILNEIAKKNLVKLYQTIFFIPYFISWVVAGYMFYAFLNMKYGILNGFLQVIGLHPVEWYADAGFWPFIIVFAYLWKNTGYFSVIYYAGLMGIDGELYEAAAIDGASKLQMITKISLPLLRPLITIMVILQIGKVFFSDFGLFYYIPWDVGALYPATDVIDTYVFRTMRVTGDFGLAAATSLYQSVVGLLLVIVTNSIVRKTTPDNSLF